MKILSVILMFITSVMHAQNTQLIAHRGFWKTENSAQNSISSLKNAQQLGVYGSEFDVRMTKDGVLMINHDEDINGILIAENHYQVLKHLSLKNGEYIPTFRQYLEQGKKVPQMKMIVELKPEKSAEREIQMAKQAVKIIRELNMEAQCEFISFSLNICKVLKKEMPDAVVLYLNGELSPAELKAAGLDGLDYHHRILTERNPHWLAEAQKLGLVTNAWTVNDQKTYQQLKSLGIQFITTDIPDEIKNLKNEK
ncbi:glycerophosphodiester phosphodiesterase [Chryseobacterium lacus]|uniref:glycerophosphodiester phosphodiesterase n=1 Tax=Chryseobacterium lacus TaxID=2058346 RepID=UPI000F89C319|nr:glycerophosphodiester phosphodiesterase family protein [Chryseobacterium lacus]RST27669.1 glycerophosphodiester phosphodiesterase [Chryseobacterium lacus]